MRERKHERLCIYLIERETTIKDRAAEWFHSKWGVPQEAYLECMEAYLNNETEYGMVSLFRWEPNDRGIGSNLKMIFYDRKDFTPNICAVYTEEEYRCKGIAGHLLIWLLRI